MERYTVYGTVTICDKELEEMHCARMRSRVFANDIWQAMDDACNMWQNMFVTGCNVDAVDIGIDDIEAWEW